MLNNLVLVGRLKEINKEEKEIIINSPIDKETDNLLNIKLSDNIFDNLVSYCKINDMIGIKGRIVNNNINVEKISFLTASSNVEKQEA